MKISDEPLNMFPLEKETVWGHSMYHLFLFGDFALPWFWG